MVITITLHVSELIFDIENKAHLTGQSRLTGDNYEAAAHMQASSDESSRTQILRSIGSAWAQLKSKVSEYLVESETTSSNVLMTDSGKLTLSLNMPANYNPTSRDAVTSSLHEYLVARSLGEWFIITNKADAQDHFVIANSKLETLREALSRRQRPKRTAPTL